MADHVIDANWVKTSNVDLGESGFQQPRSRGPRRAAHAAAPGCHRPEMTAALPVSAGVCRGLPGRRLTTAPDVTGHVAPAPDVSSDY
jgi:hypothetical protein